MTKIIWTTGFRPFIMGGNVNAPLAAKVEVGKPVKLSKDISVFVVKSPLTGETHVADADSGALVGTSLKSVREDVRTGDKKVMKKQIAEAKEQFKKAVMLEPEEFWKKMANAR